MSTPCADPENDPNDWFITLHGKQYNDEVFVTESEKLRMAKTVLWRAGEPVAEHQDRVDRAVAALERERRRKALQKRRHAREKCRQCPIRQECLDTALEKQIEHGTWGGLFEEERRRILMRNPRRKFI